MIAPYRNGGGNRAPHLISSFHSRAYRAEGVSFEEVEDCFREIMREPIMQASGMGEVDIVVGVPFYNEADTIASVLTTIRKGLDEFYPNQKSVIVAAGAPAGGEALRIINNLPKSDKGHVIAFLLDDERINGKGWGVRAIIEIAQNLAADLALLEADLRSREKNGQTEGLTPEWISLLLEPIIGKKADMVISRFNHHYLEDTISTLLAYPLFAAIYNRPVHRLLGGQWGISQNLFQAFSQDARYTWNIEMSGYGVDTWLATTAITSEAVICETNLGIKIHKPSEAKTEMVLRQVANVLFDRIVTDREWWEETEKLLLRPLATFGTKTTHQPDEIQLNPDTLMEKYKNGFNKFHSLYEKILPSETYGRMEKLAEVETRWFDFPASLWAHITYHFLLAYAFDKRFAKGDLMNSLVPLHDGHLASFVLETQKLKASLECLPPDMAEHLVSLEAERKIEDLAEEFIHQKTIFLASWEMSEEIIKPPVPKVTYREFIPGVPLVVPLELTNLEGNMVSANSIYDSIFNKHKTEFEQFIHDRLEVPQGASSLEITDRVRDFMHKLEREMSSLLLPGDLSTTEGTKDVANAIFNHFPHFDTFALIPEMASRLLWQYPPPNLLIKLGYSNLIEMLGVYEPCDILALAAWSEEQAYMEQVWRMVEEEVRSEHFATCASKPLVVSHNDFPSLVEMKDSASLDKITGRIIVSSLHKGMGGEFPKLRYFTTISKNIVEAERFGQIWARFARERKNFGSKVINSIEGHWGKEPLSAHNIFENGHHRVLVERLKQMARQISEDAAGDEDRLIFAEHLLDMADSYHVSFTLPDGQFIPCSAWTWASYSFKGGSGVPTPLSLRIERDWASDEFLTEYFKAAGGEESTIEDQIIRLMEQGRESENLAAILLGTEKGADEIVSREAIAPTSQQPLAGTLKRFAANPVLKPIKEHPWESKYVLNAGAIRLGGKVFLVYRAFGEDNISRLGLAASKDGFEFTERLETPIFEPNGKNEEKGCEDPRLTLIGDRIYMLYTAYSSLAAQIAMASISTKDFMNHKWESWHRHGLVFPGFTDKDATIFPDQFNGKYAMLHRVDPHIWLTFSPHLRCPWPRKEHKILAGSTSGMMWDGRKIGAGAQPIKTKYGWLLITHGVDYAHFYRLGVILLELTDPSRVIYRSPNFILEPKDSEEIGEGGNYWVPNVVFTCGALPRVGRNKKLLDAKDELIVYYGAADTMISIATTRISDLIPEEFRQG